MPSQLSAVELGARLGRVLAGRAGGSAAAASRGLQTSAARLGGHAREFVHQQERLGNKRLSDLMHFYIVGLGFMPMGLIALYQAMKYGRCRLEPLPENRVPRHWEYEDTVLKQMRAKYLLKNPVMVHDVHQGQYNWYDLKRSMAYKQRRMEHLSSQRQDYPAIYHRSTQTNWLEISLYFQEESRHNYQGFKHDPTCDAAALDFGGVSYS